ncbi:hypothetical protein P8605_43035, partial [Streptomyces sp. T-3]|nr:hypothetical protein [Streptomyces sp. T-3]
LNQGAPLGAAAEGPQAVLGTDADPLVSVGSGRLRLRYADSVAPHLYDTLGLAGYRAVVPGPKTAARLARAAAALPELLPAAATTVDRYVGALVLLKPSAGVSAPSESMISCSFDGLPFTAFLTGFGLHHLVPGFMFAEPCLYSLQESLYHEALRLALNEEQRLVDHFAHDDDRATLVYVSWRSEWRTAQHCLRMLYVYAHLARLRAAAVQYAARCDDSTPTEPAVTEEVLAEALRSVRACARELANSLAGLRYLFSEAGLALLDEIDVLLPAADVVETPS